jgi:hypothetical protein
MKKVISFSLWGNIPIYCAGAIENAKLQKTIYPDWVCRFYVDKSVPTAIIEKLRELNSEIVLMDSNEFIGSQRMFWRFLIASDSTVDRAIIRDTDSRLNLREEKSVKEWETSNLPFHIMRDHPFHATEILGGLWGCTKEIFLNMNTLCRSWLSVHRNLIERGADQLFLRECIWPLVRDNHLAHASHCFYTGKEKPFEVVLPDNMFVGQQFNELNQPILR